MTEKINVKDELKKIKPRPPKEIIYQEYFIPKDGTDYIKILKYEALNDSLKLYLGVTHYPDEYYFEPSPHNATWIVPKNINHGSSYHSILEAAKKHNGRIEGLELVVTSNRIRKKGPMDIIKKPGKKKKLIKPEYPFH